MRACGDVVTCVYLLLPLTLLPSFPLCLVTTPAVHCLAHWPIHWIASLVSCAEDAGCRAHVVVHPPEAAHRRPAQYAWMQRAWDRPYDPTIYSGGMGTAEEGIALYEDWGLYAPCMECSDEAPASPPESLSSLSSQEASPHSPTSPRPRGCMLTDQQVLWLSCMLPVALSFATMCRTACTRVRSPLLLTKRDSLIPMFVRVIPSVALMLLDLGPTTLAREHNWLEKASLSRAGPQLQSLERSFPAQVCAAR